MANIDTDVLAELIWAQMKDLIPERSSHDHAAATVVTRIVVTVAATFPDAGDANRFMDLAMLGKES